jgi:hypothetical protein
MQQVALGSQNDGFQTTGHFSSIRCPWRVAAPRGICYGCPCHRRLPSPQSRVSAGDTVSGLATLRPLSSGSLEDAAWFCASIVCFSARSPQEEFLVHLRPRIRILQTCAVGFPLKELQASHMHSGFGTWAPSSVEWRARRRLRLIAGDAILLLRDAPLRGTVAGWDSHEGLPAAALATLRLSGSRGRWVQSRQATKTNVWDVVRLHGGGPPWWIG